MYLKIRTALAMTTLVATLGLISQEASAQAGTDEVARRMVSSAIQAAEGGDWVTARQNFQKAYEVQPLPLTLYNLAAAQEKTSQFVEADRSYRIFLRDTNTGGQAKEFRRLAIEARERLKKQISYLVIAVTNLHKNDILRIGGAEIAHAIIGESTPTNPGDVEVSIERDGTLVERKKMSLSPGSTKQVQITLNKKLERVAEETTLGGGVQNGNPTEVVPVEEESSGALLWTAVGVGAVVVVGAAVGATVFLTPGPSYESDLDAVDLAAR